MVAPYKLHGGNSTTRSLHAWTECTKREYAKDVPPEPEPDLPGSARMLVAGTTSLLPNWVYVTPKFTPLIFVISASYHTPLRKTCQQVMGNTVRTRVAQ